MLRNLDAAIKNVNIYPSIPRYIECPHNWSSDTCEDSHSFVYVMEGSFILHVDDKPYVVQKNHLAYFPADVRIRGWLTPERKLNILKFNLKAETNGQDLFTYFNLKNVNHVIFVPREDMWNLYQSMREPKQAVGNIPENLAMISGYVELIRIYMQTRIRLEQADSMFSDVIKYIHEHLAEDIALQTLAKLKNLNEGYFTEKFKKEMGITPMKYIAQCRAKKATELLLYTDMPIRDVANAVGIRDVYYFVRFFQKQIGIRPEKYKKSFY